MDDETKRPEQETSKVDDYIITGCITLLAAFAVMLTIKTPSNKLISLASLTSLFSLIVSLFSSLWHKYRYPIRRQFFEREKKKLIDEKSDHIANFLELYVMKSPDAGKEFYQAFGGGLGKPDTVNQYFGKYVQQTRHTIVAHLKALEMEMRSLQKKAFDRPLSEKKARLKCLVDVLSRKLRYVGFVVGVLLLFIAVLVAMASNV